MTEVRTTPCLVKRTKSNSHPLPWSSLRLKAPPAIPNRPPRSHVSPAALAAILSDMHTRAPKRKAASNMGQVASNKPTTNFKTKASHRCNTREPRAPRTTQTPNQGPKCFLVNTHPQICAWVNDSSGCRVASFLTGRGTSAERIPCQCRGSQGAKTEPTSVLSVAGKEDGADEIVTGSAWLIQAETQAHDWAAE